MATTYQDKVASRINLPIMIGILLVMAFITYSNSLFNDFVWDDHQIVVNNPINRDFSNIKQVLFAADVAFADDVTNYYRPLNRLTYMIEYQIFGMNPKGYHLVNILIHAANVLLLFLLGLKLFREQIAAFTAALLFAVHPINVEAVNFISGRNNALATLFVLLTVLTFIKGERTKSYSWFILAGIAIFCGLLSKEIALMTLPFLFFYPRIESDVSYAIVLKQRLLTLIPSGVATLVYLLLRFSVLQSFATSEGMSLWRRLAQNFYALPKYLSLILYPTGLQAYHVIPASYSDSWLLLAGWLLIIGILLLLYKNRNLPILFSLLWIVLNYIPISQIVFFPSAPIAERYIYLPALGLWLLAGAFVQWLIIRQHWKKLVPVAVTTAMILIVLTIQRNRDWRNDLTLFSSLVRVEPSSVFGHYNLGCTYLALGNLELASKHWQSTLEIAPDHSQALNQLGSYALIQGRLAEAELFYSKSVKVNPNNAEAHYNLAMALSKTGQTTSAVAQYELFLRRVPFEYQHLVPEVKTRIEELRRITR